MLENILARVGGQYVAVALQSLPSAATDTESERHAVIEVPALGRVRFFCKRFIPQKGRARTPFWSCRTC